jgi:hypothetical protein
MESNENNWTLGEIAKLPKMERLLKQSVSTVYMHYIASRYVCIREATEGQRGILVKVLGKVYGDQVGMVNGQPFCKDDNEDLFTGNGYYCYPFPSVKDVQEVLEILKGNQSLIDKFEAAKMHINPNSTFWVRDTTRNKLLLKKPQYFSTRDGQLYPARDEDNHYRLSIVYFYKGQLNW